MFSNSTTITFYQTVGSDEWLFTVYVTKVNETDPKEVHTRYSLHMLCAYEGGSRPGVS
jgi:hypothetical protein